jgi:ABC-type uncharacterized transport system auxiliary subunit
MTMGRLRVVTAWPTGVGGLARPLRLSLCLFLVAGCGAVADPPQRHTFLIQLDAAPTLAGAQLKPAESVYVAPVLIAAPFSGRNLVVRQSELGFATDPYAEFAASPVSMWTDAVRSWLDARHLFERVLPVGSSADAGLTLETNLLEAVVDRRAGQLPTSRVVIRFMLVRNRAPYQVLLDRTFTGAEAVQGASAEQEVAALSLAAEHVLRGFQDALSQMSN